MGIWRYSEKQRDLELASVRSQDCLFCRERLTSLPLEKLEPGEDLKREDWRLVDGSTALARRWCLCCGWWAVLAETSVEGVYADEWGIQSAGAAGVLHELDLTDIAIPLEEVRAYLVARWSSRYEVNPRLWEECVGSVFRDLGYRARVTAFCGDRGIDVVLDGPHSTTIGVQVKRYRNAIEAEQIRAFTGALVLGGYTKGVFVTTSRFRSGAEQCANRSNEVGVPIELLDSSRFYDALRVAQRTTQATTAPPEELLSATPIALGYESGGMLA